MAMGGLNWVVSGVVAAVVLASGGCGTAEEDPMGTGCMPPPFTVSADAAAPGSHVTVSAKDADCNPAYGDGAQVQLEIMDGSGAKVVDTLAPMNDAGGFSAVVTIPASAVPGLGAVVAYPYDLDWCDDTGQNNRLKGSGDTGNGSAGTGAGDLQRASCEIPMEALTIEP